MRPPLALIPSSYTAGKLHSVLPENGAGDFTVSRNGSATYFDKDGILRTAAANEPRFEYNPDGSFKGVLVEPASTNLFSDSSNLTVTWLYSNIHQNSSDLFLLNSGRRLLNVTNDTIAASSNSMVIRNTSFSVFKGFNTISFFVKKTTDHASIGVWGFISGGSYNINFNVDTLQVARPITAPSRFKNRVADIIPLGNNVFYCYESFFIDGNYTFIIGVSPTSPGSNTMLAGQELSVAGFQFEQKEFPTSYIPTGSSGIVTRPADIITIPSYSSLFGDRNSRLININNENKIFVNEENFQLPIGHNKFAFEKNELFTVAEQDEFSATTITYGVRDDIKDELNEAVALDPSLVLIPGKGTEGTLQTIVPIDGSGDFTVSRNGTATYIGKDGLIKTAQANEPRLEFNTDGSFKGVLVEPASTNLLVHSTLTGGVPPTGWILAINNGVSEALTSIYGSLDGAVSIKMGVISGGECIQQANGISYLAGSTYTISVLIENISGNIQARNLMRLTGNMGALGQFRLNGISISDSANVTTGVLELIVTPTTNNTSQVRIGAGTGWFGAVSASVTISRPQIEVSSVRSSFIPTGEFTVTRPRDTIQKGNLDSILNENFLSFYYEIHKTKTGILQEGAIILNNVTNYLIRIRFTSDNRVSVLYFNQNAGMSGAGNLTPFSQEIPLGINKILVRINKLTNQASGFVNGVMLNQITLSFPLPDNQNTIDISLISGLRDCVKNITVFTNLLSDSEAIQLTTL